MTNRRFADYILGIAFAPLAFRLRAEINELLDAVWEMPLDAADTLTAQLIDKYLTLSYTDGDPNIMTPTHLGALKSIQVRTAARKVALV